MPVAATLGCWRASVSGAGKRRRRSLAALFGPLSLPTAPIAEPQAIFIILALDLALGDLLCLLLTLCYLKHYQDRVVLQNPKQNVLCAHSAEDHLTLTILFLSESFWGFSDEALHMEEKIPE